MSFGALMMAANSGSILTSNSWTISTDDHVGYASASLSAISGGVDQGSLVPAEVSGEVVLGLYVGNGVALTVWVEGLHAQSLFDSVKCSLGTFETASATSYAQSGGNTRWLWNPSGGNLAGSELIIFL